MDFPGWSNNVIRFDEEGKAIRPSVVDRVKSFISQVSTTTTWTYVLYIEYDTSTFLSTVNQSRFRHVQERDAPDTEFVGYLADLKAGNRAIFFIFWRKIHRSHFYSKPKTAQFHFKIEKMYYSFLKT